MLGDRLSLRSSLVKFTAGNRFVNPWYGGDGLHSAVLSEATRLDACSGSPCSPCAKKQALYPEMALK
jgi:hypothetical protein